MQGLFFDYTDNQIISGLINQDNAIIQFVYFKFLPKIKNYIIKNNGDETIAEDIFQEAIVIIYIRIKKQNLKLSSSFFTYLFSVCKNLWLHHLRKVKSQKIQYIDNFESIFLVEQENQCCIETSFTQLFYKHFNSQSKKNQLVIRLHFNKVSAVEIAETMGFKNKEYAISKKYKCLKRLISDIKNDPCLQNLNILEHERVELF